LKRIDKNAAEIYSRRIRDNEGQKMTRAKQGDRVKVHYNLKLKDGRDIVSTASGDPLEFKNGGGEIFPKFEQAVVGMSSGRSHGKTKLLMFSPIGTYRLEKEVAGLQGINHESVVYDLRPKRSRVKRGEK